MIRMGKIGGGLELLSNVFMASELQAVIKGDRLDGKTTVTQGLDRSQSQCMGVFGG